MTISVRELQSTDVETILGLRLQWLSQTFDVSDTTSKVRDWFSNYLGNPQSFALVATDRQACVGYILCDLLAHPIMSGLSAMIEEVCVAEPFRRRGIGRRLVLEARQRLVSRVDDLTTIRAQIDRKDDRAIAFWSALGFEQHVIEFTDYLEIQQ